MKGDTYRIEDGPWWVDVRIVCTDKDTHDVRELAVIRLDDEGTLSEVGTGQGRGRTVHRTPAMKHIGDRPRHPLKCPTCRRDVPLRAETMRRLVEGAVADKKPEVGGRVPVDISYLPANFA